MEIKQSSLLYSSNTFKTHNLKKVSFMRNTVKEDLHIKSEENNVEQNNFSYKKAGKYFIKGILKPLRSIIRHPIKSLTALAITYGLCSVIPVLIPILTVGLGLFSIYETGKGLLNAYIKQKKKNTDQAEKYFQIVGQGVTGLGLTAIGLRYNANIVIGAKSAQAERLSVDNTAQMTFLNALKEHLFLFTTPEGRGIIINQLKPSSIKSKIKDLSSLITPFKNLDFKQVIDEITPNLTLPSFGFATKTLLVSSKMFNTNEASP